MAADDTSPTAGATPRQRATTVVLHYLHGDGHARFEEAVESLTDCIAEAIEEAVAAGVAAERKRCLAIADGDDEPDDAAVAACRRIAAAIRDGSPADAE